MGATTPASHAQNGAVRFGACRPPADAALASRQGWDFLELRKQDPRLAPIPVVVFSALGDVAPDPTPLGVAASITKPLGEDGLIDRVLGTVNGVLGRPAA